MYLHLVEFFAQKLLMKFYATKKSCYPSKPTTRIVLIQDSFFMTIFFVKDYQKRTWILLKPNLGPIFCDKIY